MARKMQKNPEPFDQAAEVVTGGAMLTLTPNS
jgi:hypothetical protein